MSTQANICKISENAIFVLRKPYSPRQLNWIVVNGGKKSSFSFLLKLFMLSQYRQRISWFSAVAASSLLSISNRLQRQETVEDAVEKHIMVVAKMKRRMKQMLDVADKYAVEDTH